MADKTQVATAVLAARYEPLALVVLGTTAGMLAANVPVVLGGEALARRMPLALARPRRPAALFAALGVLAWVWPY